MSTAETFLILSVIVEMMAIGFGLLFYLYRHTRLPARILFSILGVLAVISSVSIAISRAFFWNGGSVVSISIIAFTALFLVVPLFSSGKLVEWRKGLVYSVPAVAVLLYFELAMGFFYGSAFLPHSLNPVTLVVDNLDFSLMMIIDAVFFFLISTRKKALAEYALLTFALSMSIMPNFYFSQGRAVILTSAILSSALMVLNAVILYIVQMRIKDFRHQLLAITMAAMDFLMMLGLSFYAIRGNLNLMSYAMVIAMAAYFFLITHRTARGKKVAGLRYSFPLLVFINAAELAMSLGVSSLGFAVSNSLFPPSGSNFGYFFSGMEPGMVKSINFSNPLWWIFPFDPGKIGMMAFHAGLSVNAPFAWFWSSFMLIMMTTMTPFYAIMMGSEMSYLVLDRYRMTGNRKVRNWALAIMAGIPLFVVLVPFYSPLYIFGMSGMLFSVPLALFLVSVAAVIIASIVLGRRVQCNLVCMAAHMWTNSYYGQFKPPRDHNVAWGALRWISFGIMSLSFGLFVMQELGWAGPIKVGMVVINPLIFYGMFVLNYVWWFFYFLTPVFGAYSCARQGWCGFGTLSGIFNKLFFRIRARDVSLCQSCETRSCEKSCPTAIPLVSDMSRKGFSNRISCIGCGDCIEACELKNLEMLDLTSRLRKKRAPERNAQ